MKPLSKEQAIKEHRKMWNWIADETLKRQEIVTKEDYMKEVFLKESPDNKIPSLYCFCCEYVDQLNQKGFSCKFCPLIWDNDYPNSMFCSILGSIYLIWLDFCNSHANTYYIKASKLAREIANLPEREDDYEMYDKGYNDGVSDALNNLELDDVLEYISETAERKNLLEIFETVKNRLKKEVDFYE